MSTTTITPPSSPQRGRRRWAWAPVAIALAFTLGVSVLLYPTGASWFTQRQQSHRVAQLGQEMAELGPAAEQQAIAAAQQYNATLTGGATVRAHARLPHADAGSNADDSTYQQLLRADSSGLMARIKIPSIGLDLPIYHGTSDDVLQRGIGHLEGTALPVGGAGTHAVLTGHRGLATSTLFTHLNEVKVGDMFTIEVFGEVLTYRVIDTKVVDPKDTATLHPRQGQDLVTLVTCTPLGINSQRILVTGERVLPTPAADLAAAGRGPTIPGFPWWAVELAGTLAASTAYVWLTALGQRRRAIRTHTEETS